jgi:hypothetical protein
VVTGAVGMGAALVVGAGVVVVADPLVVVGAPVVVVATSVVVVTTGTTVPNFATLLPIVPTAHTLPSGPFAIPFRPNALGAANDVRASAPATNDKRETLFKPFSVIHTPDPSVEVIESGFAPLGSASSIR